MFRRCERHTTFLEQKLIDRIKVNGHSETCSSLYIKPFLRYHSGKATNLIYYFQNVDFYVVEDLPGQGLLQRVVQRSGLIDTMYLKQLISLMIPLLHTVDFFFDIFQS